MQIKNYFIIIIIYIVLQSLALFFEKDKRIFCLFTKFVIMYEIILFIVISFLYLLNLSLLIKDEYFVVANILPMIQLAWFGIGWRFNLLK